MDKPKIKQGTKTPEPEGPAALQMPVASVIRRLRTGLGMSQEAFADRIAMHRTYYSGIERGQRNLTLRSLERISEGLGTPVSEVIRLAEKER
jgi:transcriptional regulator with XRE-family HTH domain